MTTIKLALALTVTLVVCACGTNAADGPDVALEGDGTPVSSDRRAPSPAPSETRAATPRATERYLDVTLPYGTTLPLVMASGVASDRSAVGDAVTAELQRPVGVDGREILPAGTRLSGQVTDVVDSGRVKGRASVVVRFNSLQLGDRRYDVTTAQVSRTAAATKSEDATKIGIGAGAGAILGGILGGKDGAAKGAVVGGGAGTGVVLATKGEAVRLGPGDDVTTTLTEPLTVRVRVG